jgi:hypothetical protein
VCVSACLCTRIHRTTHTPLGEAPAPTVYACVYVTMCTCVTLCIPACVRACVTQPFIYLGQRLRRVEGHRVRIATHARWAGTYGRTEVKLCVCGCVGGWVWRHCVCVDSPVYLCHRVRIATHARWAGSWANESQAVWVWVCVASLYVCVCSVCVCIRPCTWTTASASPHTPGGWAPYGRRKVKLCGCVCGVTVCVCVCVCANQTEARSVGVCSHRVRACVVCVCVCLRVCVRACMHEPVCP